MDCIDALAYSVLINQLILILVSAKLFDILQQWETCLECVISQMYIIIIILYILSFYTDIWVQVLNNIEYNNYANNDNYSCASNITGSSSKVTRFSSIPYMFVCVPDITRE